MPKSQLLLNNKEKREELKTKPKEKLCWKESKDTPPNTRRKSLNWLPQEEQQRLMDRSLCLPSLRLPSSSELEVWTNLTQEVSEFWDSSDSDSFTTEPSWESTRPLSICWEESNPISPSDILQSKPSESWFWREVMARSTTKEFPWLTTDLLKVHWENSESLQLRIWSMKSPPLALTSRKPTTSFGPSNWEVPEEASPRRDILSKEEEIGETESTSSMTSLRECFDLLILFKSDPTINKLSNRDFE